MAEDLLSQIVRRVPELPSDPFSSRRQWLRKKEKGRRESYDSHPVAPLALLYLDNKVLNLS